VERSFSRCNPEYFWSTVFGSHKQSRVNLEDQESWFAHMIYLKAMYIIAVVSFIADDISTVFVGVD